MRMTQLGPGGNAVQEVHSEVVSCLRSWRTEGLSLGCMVQRLIDRGLDLDDIEGQFQGAFFLDGPPDLVILLSDFLKDDDTIDAVVFEPLEAVVGPDIDDKRDVWESAPPYPDLMRRRDRHAFRELAHSEKVIVVVAASNPYSGRHIGQPGIRVSPLHLFSVARLDPPNAGLVAADPGDGRLAALRESAYPGSSYENFLSELARRGFAVAGPDEGYVLRDAGGNLLHPGYSVQGVYRKEGGADLWRGAEGERMRAELNRLMGLELVRYGPHDAWEQRTRLPDACPARGPEVPVLEFDAWGNVNVLFDVADVASSYRFRGIAWSELYPGMGEKAGTVDDGEDSENEELQ